MQLFGAEKPAPFLTSTDQNLLQGKIDDAVIFYERFGKVSRHVVNGLNLAKGFDKGIPIRIPIDKEGMQTIPELCLARTIHQAGYYIGRDWGLQDVLAKIPPRPGPNDFWTDKEIISILWSVDLPNLHLKIRNNRDWNWMNGEIRRGCLSLGTIIELNVDRFVDRGIEGDEHFVLIIDANKGGDYIVANPSTRQFHEGVEMMGMHVYPGKYFRCLASGFVGELNKGSTGVLPGSVWYPPEFFLIYPPWVTMPHRKAARAEKVVNGSGRIALRS